MCSGRVDLAFVLRAFLKGADGVFIGACRLNECNYTTQGNYHALSLVHICRKVLEHIGLNPERVRIAFMSGAEANLFVENVNGFVKTIKDLGPFGKAEGLDEKGLQLKLQTVANLVPYIRLVERERLRGSYGSEEECAEYFASDEVNRLFTELVLNKVAIGTITSLLREQPLSTGEISEILGLTPSDVSKYMNSSSRQGLVRYDVNRKCFALV